MTENRRYPLLEQINSPHDLRDLSESQLEVVRDELRDYLLRSVAKTGGHLAGGLGTVELTVALHHVFNTPEDRIVWDVGHQAYPHKILTGRRDRMHTIRQKDGLAGFPKRGESEYDTFGVGHSSTSISAALGMAIASQLTKQERECIAVIGDGAMTAGQAFEALEHAGDIKANMIVVLNDNEMSISPNVGALSNHLAKALSGKVYSSVRSGSKRVLGKLPPVWELAKRAEEHVKGMVVPGTIFEELGFNYFGPVDGHDLPTLIKVLKNLKSIDGPRLLHIITRKGKGYKPSEENPVTYHAVKPFNPDKGLESSKPATPSSPTYTQVFGQWLCDIAEQDTKAVGITPAMREGSGLVEFSQQYPDRYFDVAIAEQHSVTVAAGMACEGAKPIVAIYSTFLQRGYDQLIHDVAIQNLDVTFAIDRAGLVGPDGPTHAGSFDISFMRCIPNMVIMAPADENECRQMLYTAYQYPGPAAVRYPRGKGPGVPVQSNMAEIPLGTGEIQRRGKQVAILAFGAVYTACANVADELNATCANMRFIKPIDEALILNLAVDHDYIVTVEENSAIGGAGEAVREVLEQNNIERRVKVIGLPDAFIEHGSREELLTECLLDEAGIKQQIVTWLANIAPESSKLSQSI